VVRFDAQALMPVDQETAFDLSLSIDTHLGSFEHSGERAIDGVTAGLIGLGEFVTWRTRHLGITWTMTSTITDWDRPRRFVDEQRKGPLLARYLRQLIHVRNTFLVTEATRLGATKGSGGAA
jgi:hypothetical protein